MSRRDIYYWKCDRPAAFHGTHSRTAPDPGIAQLLRDELQDHFQSPQIVLHPANVQGNHMAWTSIIGDQAVFIRVEDGPENDRHLEVETNLLDRVRQAGVKAPRVLGCDASRTRVPFAWQVLERIPAPDLNHWFKEGVLKTQRIAHDIGRAIATWQNIGLEGFGTLDFQLRGSRDSYADYFHLRLEEHLHFLKSHGFLSDTERILAEIREHEALLNVERGCLVHKDLALWNILGQPDTIESFIDFDDAISGDSLDDLSLLGCFHDWSFLECALEGYQSIRSLPVDYRRRFWIHLLRNMIVKAVIRLGAGYFKRSDRFFLIGAGLSGTHLEQTTRERLALARRGLCQDLELSVI